MNELTDSFSNVRAALITGAGGGGVGSDVAFRLAALGIPVVLNSWKREGLDEVVEAILDAGGRATACVFDVRMRDAIADAIAQLPVDFRSMNVLVHNAAPSLSGGPTSELEVDAWSVEVDTILTGAFNCCQAILPEMVRLGWGRIVFVSSSAAFRGAAGRSAGYAAAKAGLHGLTYQLAWELGKQGITVNSIAPAQLDTPRIRRNGRKTTNDLAQLAQKFYPVGRVGIPADVSSLVSFLLQIESGFLTGQVIRLDGGSSLIPQSA